MTAARRIAAPDGRPLTELTRDEFPHTRGGSASRHRYPVQGKDVARSLVRRIRPRISCTVVKFSRATLRNRPRNTVIEGDNQAMVNAGEVAQLLDPPVLRTSINRPAIGYANKTGTRIRFTNTAAIAVITRIIGLATALRPI